MDRLLIVAAVVLAAVVIAWLARRRRPDAPVRTGYHVPDHLDRAEFADPTIPWLVAVFTAATCSGCATTLERAKALAGPQVTVQDVEEQRDAELHRRYRVEAVPMIVVVDHEGVRRASVLGPVRGDELADAMAQLTSGEAGEPDRGSAVDIRGHGRSDGNGQAGRPGSQTHE